MAPLPPVSADVFAKALNARPKPSKRARAIYGEIPATAKALPLFGYFCNLSDERPVLIAPDFDAPLLLSNKG
jgi:hypothetical protein